jgi:lysocardiolipin and lysophospholipid acyltransferase
MSDACWRAATGAYLVAVTLASGVVVDVGAGAVVAAWLLLQLPRRRLVALRSFVLRRWMRIFVGHLERFSGVTFVVSGDAFRDGEAALVVCNHRSWMDTVALYSLARQVGGDGDVKFIAKKSLLAFPVFGVAGWLLGVVIFITRRAARAGKHLDATYASLADPARRGWPFWLISYLEGTRRTRAKLDAAHDFAKRRDLPVLRHVLQPRTKGFVAAAAALRGTAAAVYDVTLGYEEEGDAERSVTPDFVTSLLVPSCAQRVVHVHQRRIPLDEVPQDEEEVRAWVYRLYEQKDRLLDEFARTGKFPGRAVPWHRISGRMLAESHAMLWLSCAAISLALVRGTGLAVSKLS